MNCSIDKLLGTYKDYLLVKYKDKLGTFENIERSNPDGARFEAVIFNMARIQGLNPIISENIITGGLDFKCNYKGYEFFVEATHLNTTSVEQKSRLSNSPTGIIAQWHSMITEKLQLTANDKAKQAKSSSIPVVLCIGSRHIASTILLGVTAATFCFTSDTFLEVPIGDTECRVNLVTNAKHSFFFEWDEVSSKFKPRNKSISAVLLFSLANNSYRTIGLLHPEPELPFKIEPFPGIPFLRAVNWPFSDNKIKTEWVIHSPYPSQIPYEEIRLTEKELRKS